MLPATPFQPEPRIQGSTAELPVDLPAIINTKAADHVQFRASTEALPVGIFHTDHHGAFTYVNPAWQTLTGLSLSDAQDTAWFKAIHADDRATVLAAWQQALHDKADVSLEFRIVSTGENTSIKIVHAQARALRSDQGVILGFVGTLEDISARYQQQRELAASQQRMEVATKSGGIGIWEMDIAKGELTWDARLHELYGLSEAPVIPGESGYALWQRHVHPEDWPRLEKSLRETCMLGKEYDEEYRIVWHDGSVHFMRATASVTRNSKGAPIKMIGANWDVSPLRQATAELEKQHDLLSVTLASIADAVITTDENGKVVWLNPVAEKMTGWTNADAAGLCLTQVLNIVHEESRESLANPVALCLQTQQAITPSEHTVLIARDGREYGIQESASPIRSRQGVILGVVLVFHDVTEARRLSSEMHYRATHDSLTGLLNRGEFELRLKKLLHTAQEKNTEHALLCLDLDQFKLVNDVCGHAVGDQLLQQVAKLLSDSVRSRDLVARLGGDEFAIILERCSGEQAQRIGQLICDRMEEFRFTHDGRRFRIGASIGAVPVDARWNNTEAIMKAADASCYAAKEAGRNRVHAWYDTDQAMKARTGEMQWTTRIEQALDEDGFVLFAQRISQIGVAPDLIHAEVLIRMRETDGSLIAPGAFLPAAERFHLASRIDRWVVRHALTWMTNLENLTQLGNLSVNLSGQSIGDRAFHRWVFELLSKTSPAICQRLCFEITETAAMTNLADATAFIEHAHSLGIRIALDDFGSGASSFGYLKTMPVDYLKIDGQFIRDVVTDALDEAAVKCFADVARVVGMKTVAEFVDQPTVLQRLTEIGIDYAQGYLMHKPEPIDRLLIA